MIDNRVDTWKRLILIFDRVRYLATYYSIVFRVIRSLFEQCIGIGKWYDGGVRGDGW